jgi:hypothetical protein
MVSALVAALATAETSFTCFMITDDGAEGDWIVTPAVGV